jgi:class 3 adenylate cyclase
VKVNHLLPREMPARSIGQPGAGTPVPPRSDRVARGPARGIRCASAIVASVRALGLEVRAGLHTGECEVIGEKLGGIAVNIGARVASRAGLGRCSSRALSKISSPAQESASPTAPQSS